MNDTLKRVDTTPIIARMAELCPQCIFVYEGRRQPLKTGIYADIIAKVGGAITPDELKLALRSYVRNIGYQKAMARPGAMRVDTEGNPVEAASEQHAASATRAAAAYFARQVARKAAARAACAEPEAPGASGAFVTGAHVRTPSPLKLERFEGRSSSEEGGGTMMNRDQTAMQAALDAAHRARDVRAAKAYAARLAAKNSEERQQAYAGRVICRAVGKLP